MPLIARLGRIGFASVAALAAMLATGAAPATAQSGHPHHGHADAGASPADSGHAAHAGMTGALGGYPMEREASGTSWQPEVLPMDGLHRSSGRWMLMLHGQADFVLNHQGGRRGDDDSFVSSMFMAMGQRPLGAGTWAFRTMFSLDPLMGRAGYPLLLQTGETADGEHELVDRQHPHDFFVELATSYSVPVGGGSLFGYVGLPGEPALGPPAFMHRASGMQLPEAPLSHHWLDSTHVTFGVVTLGGTRGAFKLEASAFNGREPDESRWDIETGRLDSWSARASFNPSPEWSAQVSHGHLVAPEQLEPDVDVDRTTASLSWARRDGAAWWSATAAAGVNRAHGDDHAAWLFELTRQTAGPLSWFVRAEQVENEHLVDDGPLAGRPFDVGKVSVGGAWRLGSTGPLAWSVGAIVSGYAIPRALEPEYDGEPASAMLFLRTNLAAPG